MIDNLYAKYLLADRLNKIAERAGVRVDHVSIRNYVGGYDTVHLQVGHADGRSDEKNEVAAVQLLDAMPDLKLVRSRGLIYLRGISSAGIKFEFYTGSGVCERVQVGTRRVPAQPARTEPIYEIRCPDPITAAVAS